MKKLLVIVFSLLISFDISFCNIKRAFVAKRVGDSRKILILTTDFADDYKVRMNVVNHVLMCAQSLGVYSSILYSSFYSPTEYFCQKQSPEYPLVELFLSGDKQKFSEGDIINYFKYGPSTVFSTNCNQDCYNLEACQLFWFVIWTLYVFGELKKDPQAFGEYLQKNGLGPEFYSDFIKFFSIICNYYCWADLFMEPTMLFDKISFYEKIKNGMLPCDAKIVDRLTFYKQFLGCDLALMADISDCVKDLCDFTGIMDLVGVNIDSIYKQNCLIFSQILEKIQVYEQLNNRHVFDTVSNVKFLFQLLQDKAKLKVLFIKHSDVDKVKNDLKLCGYRVSRCMLTSAHKIDGLWGIIHGLV